MVLQLDYPTAGITERSAASYWTAIYNYLTNSPLKQIFDFSELTIDTETYANTGFTMTYKSGTPLYAVNNASPDTFSFSGNGTDEIKISQSMALGTYPAQSYSVSTNGFENDVGFKADETGSIIYFIAFRVGVVGSNYVPAWWFEKNGAGCLLYHSGYRMLFLYAAGNGSIRIITGVPESFGRTTAGISSQYYLKPLVYGDAAFADVYTIDGGASEQSSMWKGEFTFNGSTYHCIGDWCGSSLCFKVG